MTHKRTLVLLFCWTVFVFYLHFRVPEFVSSSGLWISGVWIIIALFLRERAIKVSRKFSRRKSRFGKLTFENAILSICTIASLITISILFAHSWIKYYLSSLLTTIESVSIIRFLLAFLNGMILLMLWFKLQTTRVFTDQITFLGQRIGYCTNASSKFDFDNVPLTLEMIKPKWNYLLDTCVNLTSRFLISIKEIIELEKGPISAWLLIPNHQKMNFDIIAFCLPPEQPMWEPVFSLFAEKHKPSFHDENKMKELFDKYKNNPILYDQFHIEKIPYTSGAGHIYYTRKSGIYNNISDCPYFDNKYLELIPSKYRKEVGFRSLIGVPLPYRNLVVGVLMIFASARRYAFFSNDLQIVKPIAYLLGSSIGFAINNNILPHEILDKAPKFEQFPY